MALNEPMAESLSHSDSSKKRGAGLLLVSFSLQGLHPRILLLLRSATSGHPFTWGLSGGNLDEADDAGGDAGRLDHNRSSSSSLSASSSLSVSFAAALRETAEEIGAVPPSAATELANGTALARGGMVTHRGKRLQKKYVVFAVKCDDEETSKWTPTLNDEHTAFGWFDAADVAQAANNGTEIQGRRLHPVVTALFVQHKPLDLLRVEVEQRETVAV